MRMGTLWADPVKKENTYLAYHVKGGYSPQQQRVGTPSKSKVSHLALGHPHHALSIGQTELHTRCLQSMPEALQSVPHLSLLTSSE